MPKTPPKTIAPGGSSAPASTTASLTLAPAPILEPGPITTGARRSTPSPISQPAPTRTPSSGSSPERAQRDQAPQGVGVALHQLRDRSDVVPVGLDLVSVEGDVALQQSRENIQRPVHEPLRLVWVAGGAAMPRLGEVVEDLTPEHVDAAVGEVGQGLGGVRLLLEALDAAVLAGDHDAELRGVLDPLGCERCDRPRGRVGLVRLAHRRQVDVGERVAGDDQEGVALGQELPRLAHPARGAEGLGLVAVGKLDPEPGAVAEVLADRLGPVGEVGDHLGETVLGQEQRDVLHHRHVQDRSHRLRHQVRDRAQPRAQARRQDHRPHRASAPTSSVSWVTVTRRQGYEDNAARGWITRAASEARPRSIAAPTA